MGPVGGTVPTAGLCHGRIRSRGRRMEGKWFSLERTSSENDLKGNRMEVRDIYRGSGKVKGLGWALKIRV